MIKRYFKDGQRLDVAGLNEITVLLDRSETELTEIGWNCWTPQQDGPPHKHNDKDQVFYVTGGVGIIKLGDKEYPAKEGCLAYVPAGLVHQTITTTEERLCYMLFNVFISGDKEGHGTFAEHIEKVKQIRRQQAETGVTEVDEEEQLEEIKDHKFYPVLLNGDVSENGASKETQLLERSETNKSELTMLSCAKGNPHTTKSNNDYELSLFVLSGDGTVSTGGESVDVVPGDLIYIEREAGYTVNSTSNKMKCLCLKSFTG